MSITHAPKVGPKVEVDPDYLADHDLGGEALVTPDQRAALDAANLSVGNRVASMADVGGEFAGTNPAALIPLAPVDYLKTFTLASEVFPAWTYADGTAGVGATVTEDNPADGPLLIDGQSPTIGQRVLFYGPNPFNAHGIYVVTEPGNGTDVPWVLTRAADCDTIAKRCRFWAVEVVSGVTFGGGSARVCMFDPAQGWVDASLASGSYSTASGSYSTASGTYSNASGTGSTASGTGSTAHSPGQSTDAAVQAGSMQRLGQHSRVELGQQTADDTPTPLYNFGNGAFSFVDAAGEPDWNKTARIKGTVVARDDSANDSAWTFEGVIRGDGTSAYSWVGGTDPVPSVIAQDGGASAWAVAVTILNSMILVTVTGAVATNISWVCDLEVVEIALARSGLH
jgi:hypothetical protein